MDDPFADLFGPPKPTVVAEQEVVQPMKTCLEKSSNASKSETPSVPGESAPLASPQLGVVQPMTVMLKEDARDYIAEAVQSSVQDAMSKIIGSMRSVLEQVTQRVQSVEQEMSELAKVVRTLAIEDVNATLNARFAVVDAAIKDVGRSVQAMRDRAELIDANTELAKLTAQGKKSCNDCQMDKSVSAPQPSPSAPALTSQSEAPPAASYQQAPVAQPAPVQAPPPQPAAPVAQQAPPVLEPSSSTTLPPVALAAAPAPPHAYPYGAPPPPASASPPFSAPPPPAGLSAPPFSGQPQPAGPPPPLGHPHQPTPSYGPAPPQYTPPMPPQAPPSTPAHAAYTPPPSSAPAPSYMPYPNPPQGPPAPPLPRPSFAPNPPAPLQTRFAPAPPPAPSRGRVEGTSQMSTQQVVQDLCQMGFEKQSIEHVIGQMVRSGQSVDLNVIVDRLMNGGGR